MSHTYNIEEDYGVDFYKGAVYEFYGDQLVHKKTGEIIRRDDLQNAYERKQFEEFTRMSEEMAKLGMKPKLRLLRSRTGQRYFCVNVKEDYNFVKLFYVDLRYVVENYDLSVREKLMYLKLALYLHFPSCAVVLKGKNPTLEELSVIMKVKERTVRDTLNGLESKGLIKTELLNGRRVIYYDPHLISRGLADVETVMKFIDSPFNPYNDGRKKSNN